MECTLKYTWSFERSIHSVRLMADYAAEFGIEYEDILKHTGITQPQLLDPNMLISGHQELQLIVNLTERLAHERPLLGMEVGSRYHFTTFGSLGLAWISSANMKEALDVALTYFPLTFAFTQFKLCSQSEGTRIDVTVHEGIPKKLWRFIIERDMLALLTVQNDLIKSNFCKKLVFAFNPATEVENYWQITGTEPEFNAKQNYIILDQARLNQKLEMANELALHAAEQQCQHILSKRQSQKKYTHAVQQILMEIKGEMPSMDAVASQLHLNSRTFRRYLAQEGTSFIQIREEVRQILADYYLSIPQFSIERIAEYLGYAETSSFIHAYKRWYGKTPHANRLN